MRITAPWQPMHAAPRDGTGFLAYGRHAADRVSGAHVHWRKGDHWWAILAFDIWRPAGGFVFAKDCRLPWSEPLCWQPLLPPERAE